MDLFFWSIDASPFGAGTLANAVRMFPGAPFGTPEPAHRLSQGWKAIATARGATTIRAEAVHFGAPLPDLTQRPDRGSPAVAAHQILDMSHSVSLLRWSSSA